jgi:hypothetical protein
MKHLAGYSCNVIYLAVSGKKKCFFLAVIVYDKPYRYKGYLEMRE